MAKNTDVTDTAEGFIDFRKDKISDMVNELLDIEDPSILQEVAIGYVKDIEDTEVQFAKASVKATISVVDQIVETCVAELRKLTNGNLGDASKIEDCLE